MVHRGRSTVQQSDAHNTKVRYGRIPIRILMLTDQLARAPFR